MTINTQLLNKKRSFIKFLPMLLLLGLNAVTGCSSSTSFNKGDSIYIKHNFCETLYRLVRPLKEHDIDKMDISDTEKDALKLKLNPLAKSYLIVTGNCVSTTVNSKSIGQFIEQEKLTIHNPNNNTFHESTFYIVHPNKANLTIGEPYSKEPGLPEGYTWANHNYYMSAKGASNIYEENKSTK